jgi:Tfp pilus assembly protein PilF
MVISPAVADPYTIHTSGENFPGKSKAPFMKAMKALDAHNMPEAIKDLQAALDAAPKFSDGWHALGVVYDKSGHKAEAKDAYTKAIDADPKMLQSYVALARVCLVLKDWQCAADTSGRMKKVDTKHDYPEIYLHEAVARFGLKDLAGAEQSANEMIRLDPKSKFPRIEYVLGRILEAKGDINGAREHMMKYLSLDAVSKDAEQVQAHMLALGKPEAAKVNPPDLELL